MRIGWGLQPAKNHKANTAGDRQEDEMDLDTEAQVLQEAAVVDQTVEDSADCPILDKITTNLENACDEQDEFTTALENIAFYGLLEKG